MKKHFFRFLLVPHLVLSILVFGIVAVFVTTMQITTWGPQEIKFQNITAQNERLKSTLAILRSRVDLSDRFVLTQAALERLDQKISSSVSQAELVSESSTFASRSNVQILHSDNIVQRGKDSTAWFQQDITVEGSYSSIQNLLRLIEGSERLTLVQQVDWTIARNGNQKVRIKLATLIREVD